MCVSSKIGGVGSNIINIEAHGFPMIDRGEGNQNQNQERKQPRRACGVYLSPPQNRSP